MLIITATFWTSYGRKKIFLTVYFLPVFRQVSRFFFFLAFQPVSKKAS